MTDDSFVTHRSLLFTVAAGRIDLAGELDTAVSLVVADGRITRVYAMRNPHKLARLDEEATLSR
jgi:hypothetical protein